MDVEPPAFAGPVSPVYTSAPYRWLQEHSRALGLRVYGREERGELARELFPWVLYEGWEKHEAFDLIPLAHSHDPGQRGLLAVWARQGEDPLTAPVVAIGMGVWHTVAADLTRFVDWAAAGTPLLDEARARFGVSGRDRERIQAEGVAVADFEARFVDLVTSIRGLSDRQVAQVDQGLVQRCAELKEYGHFAAALRLLMARIRQGRVRPPATVAIVAAQLAERLERFDDAVVATEAGHRCGVMPLHMHLKALVKTGRFEEALRLLPDTAVEEGTSRIAADILEGLGRADDAWNVRILADRADLRLQERIQALEHLPADAREAKLREWKSRVDAKVNPGLLLMLDEAIAALDEAQPLDALRAAVDSAKAEGDDQAYGLAQARLGFAMLEAGDEAAYDHLEEAVFNLPHHSEHGKRAYAALEAAGRA